MSAYDGRKFGGAASNERNSRLCPLEVVRTMSGSVASYSKTRGRPRRVVRTELVGRIAG